MQCTTSLTKFQAIRRSIFGKKKKVLRAILRSCHQILVDTSLDKEEPSCWSRNVLLIVSKTISESSFSNTCKKEEGEKMKYTKGNLDTVRNLQKSLIYIYKILSMISYRNTRVYNFVILQMLNIVILIQKDDKIHQFATNQQIVNHFKNLKPFAPDPLHF